MASVCKPAKLLCRRQSERQPNAHKERKYRVVKEQEPIAKTPVFGTRLRFAMSSKCQSGPFASPACIHLGRYPAMASSSTGRAIVKRGTLSRCDAATPCGFLNDPSQCRHNHELRAAAAELQYGAIKRPAARPDRVAPLYHDARPVQWPRDPENRTATSLVWHRSP